MVRLVPDDPVFYARIIVGYDILNVEVPVFPLRRELRVRSWTAVFIAAGDGRPCRRSIQFADDMDSCVIDRLHQVVVVNPFPFAGFSTRIPKSQSL